MLDKYQSSVICIINVFQEIQQTIKFKNYNAYVVNRNFSREEVATLIKHSMYNE